MRIGVVPYLVVLAVAFGGHLSNGQWDRMLNGQSLMVANDCTKTSCTATNEYCESYPTSFLDPPCKAKACFCRGSTRRDWRKGDCKPVTYINNIGASCTPDLETQIITVAMAACDTGSKKVTCILNQVGNVCGLGGECKADNDCPKTNTKCINGNCGCARPNEVPNLKTGRCESRNIGDTCTSNADCAGTGDGWYRPAEYNNFQLCINGKCGCDTAKSVETQFKSLSESQNEVLTIRACVAKGAAVDQKYNTSCTPNPESSTHLATSKFCESSLYCYQCLDDRPTGYPFDIGQGLCRKYNMDKSSNPSGSSQAKSHTAVVAITICLASIFNLH